MASKANTRWPLKLRAAWQRFAFRTRRLLTSVSAAIALISFAAGVALSAIVMRLPDRPDWNFILVVITGVYVVLTYLLVRTSIRQAAAAETNADLFRQQMYRETRRRAGPLLVLVDQISSRVSAWERAVRERDLSDLPAPIPDGIDEDLSRAATVDIYYHQQLSSAVRALRRAAERAANLGGEDDAKLLEQIKTDLRFARSDLYGIKASVYGWDEDEGQ